MFKVNENDSFGVELTKTCFQAFIQSFVAMTGMVLGMAAVGKILDLVNRRSNAKTNQIITPTENQE